MKTIQNVRVRNLSSDHFFRIDNRVVDKMDLSPHEWAVYVRLVRRGNQSGWCWEDQASMAKAMGMKRTTVRAVLRSLADLGLIALEVTPFEGTVIGILDFPDSDSHGPRRDHDHESPRDHAHEPPRDHDLHSKKKKKREEEDLKKNASTPPEPEVLEADDPEPNARPKRAAPLKVTDQDLALARDWHQAMTERFPTLVRSTPEQYARAIAKLRQAPNLEGQPLDWLVEEMMEFVAQSKFWSTNAVSLYRWFAKHKDREKYLSILCDMMKDKQWSARRRNELMLRALGDRAILF